MNNSDFFRRFRFNPAKRKATTPPGLPMLANWLGMWLDPMRLLLESSRRYGDVLQLKSGPTPFFFVSHPDAIKHMLQDHHRQYVHWPRVHHKLRPLLGYGLLTSEGETWRRHHTLSQPAFHRKRLGMLVGTMADATAEIIAKWDRYAETGQPIDVGAEMGRLTLAIVTRALYGLDASDQAELVGSSLVKAIHHTARKLMILFDFPDWLPLPGGRQFRQAVDALDRVVYGIIENRQRQPQERNDLLAMLMEAREEGSSEGLSAQELRDEVMTLLLAGHETSANGLTWTWHLLAQNPEVERRLHLEAVQILGGRAATFADLANLSYTLNVFEEGIRLYPPAWIMSRYALVDDEIGGWPIPSGSIVIFSPYVTQRLSAHWPDPEAFDPERFSDERSAARPRYAYFPFGGGPRQCIGNNFALMEAQVILAMLAQRYRLEPLPGHTVDPRPAMDMHPRKPMLMRVVRWEE